MNLPKRRRPQKMNCNQPPQIRCAGHLAWLRGFACSIGNAECEGRIEAAHVRTGTDGGLSVKPSDCYAIPLCGWHRFQHARGEGAFEHTYKIDMKAIARAFWSQSPHAKKLRTP